VLKKKGARLPTLYDIKFLINNENKIYYLKLIKGDFKKLQKDNVYLKKLNI